MFKFSFDSSVKILFSAVLLFVVCEIDEIRQHNISIYMHFIQLK